VAGCDVFDLPYCGKKGLSSMVYRGNLEGKNAFLWSMVCVSHLDARSAGLNGTPRLPSGRVFSPVSAFFPSMFPRGVIRVMFLYAYVRDSNAREVIGFIFLYAYVRDLTESLPRSFCQGLVRV
jgi:hypothetical protein